MNRIHRLCWLALALLMLAGAADAEQYDLLSERDFLAAAFPGARPQAGKLRISETMAAELAAVFRHRFREQKVRYWQQGTRTAWRLEEIGKEKPISIGVVVDNARLVSVAVLVYREGHGIEVAEPAFTQQFVGVALADGTGDANLLDRNIDNITGATLSVRAMTRTARAALLLDRSLQAGSRQ
jgi:hypothetical protein